MNHRMSSRARLWAAVAASGALVLGAAGCTPGPSLESSSGPQSAAETPTAVEGAQDPVELASTAQGPLPVDSVLGFAARGGTLRTLTVSTTSGDAVAGEISADGSEWTSDTRLEPDTAYVARGTIETPEGDEVPAVARAKTVPLTLDEQTYASVAPLEGETVGVGMPVIVTFDVPVQDHAAFEQHMSVTSTPAQQGSWRWISDHEAHWRPQRYWQAGTKVSVSIDVNSIPAGGGIFGQESRDVSFTIGDAVVHKVNAQTHQMQTFINGALVRTTPITTGKPGFTTRSGVKVIMEKFRAKRMNSETVGIAAGDPESYDLDNVEYAMRVTSSGEFLHAAPWSVGSQGYANVSHGCTGMSTDNARWVYDHSKRGDVVEYTGTDRPMTLTNGWGDWNLPFGQYRTGSALVGQASTG